MLEPPEGIEPSVVGFEGLVRPSGGGKWCSMKESNFLLALTKGLC